MWWKICLTSFTPGAHGGVLYPDHSRRHASSYRLALGSPMAATDSAVAAALLEAATIVQKLERQFGMNVAENGKRAVAGVLYKQKHGGNFPSVQAVFQIAGKNTFSKPSFNHYRDAMADLDDPTAVVRRNGARGRGSPAQRG